MVEDIEREIVSIIADVSGVDPEQITLDSNIAKDLEIDSIKAIEIVVAVEKKYKVSIRDEDVSKILTVRQVIDITKKLAK